MRLQVGLPTQYLSARQSHLLRRLCKKLSLCAVVFMLAGSGSRMYSTCAYRIIHNAWGEAYCTMHFHPRDTRLAVHSNLETSKHRINPPKRTPIKALYFKLFI
ncbi:hypothetical protein VFPPC_06090 [Pochonia chlamydosporia 170]|uniref:Uncharacterized protein n=1 Tax=Pochonia chlamydosporia 170 TaxID=1380566 RepID=A0A179FH85_METCM|nr:hypothetical protein VFPPC_06090 [Pochonia chlamydosporia 170]OAQ64896.1 hypothetical protein VFPPC_06090 [Pochonia chlamydosporia 170]